MSATRKGGQEFEGQVVGDGLLVRDHAVIDTHKRTPVKFRRGVGISLGKDLPQFPHRVRARWRSEIHLASQLVCKLAVEPYSQGYLLSEWGYRFTTIYR